MFFIDTGEEIKETVVRPETQLWVTTETACRIMFITKGHFNTINRPANHYHRIRYLHRSTNDHVRSARGNGFLWYRPDIEVIHHLRRQLGVSPKVAFRIFRKHMEGKLAFALRQVHDEPLDYELEES